MSKVIINGEYAHHRCDCCGKTEKGTPWTTHGPGLDAKSTWSEDSSAAPKDWGYVDVPFKKGSVTRCHLCPACVAAEKKAEDIPPDF